MSAPFELKANSSNRGLLSSSLPSVRSFVWGGGEPTKQNSPKPFIIGVAGGTASGKTSVCDLILQQLGDQRAVIISQDCFYKNLSHEEKQRAANKNYNFDHPDAFDWEYLFKVLQDLNDGRPVKIPSYDFVTHSRTEDYTTICAVDIVLFEGILVFYLEHIRELMHLKLFVEADADTRLARRIMRDIKSRGRDLEGVLNQYHKFVKPAFEQYILPTKAHADVIIPRGADNRVAIDLIVQHISAKLDEKTPKGVRKANGSNISNIKITDDTYLPFGFEV